MVFLHCLDCARAFKIGGNLDIQQLEDSRCHIHKLQADFLPPLLAGEADGRELLEVARLKLGLIADALEQQGIDDADRYL